MDGSRMGKPSPDRPRRKRERWLLTRKTWRYMADAGRRLIPEGSHSGSGSGASDLPKIEAYFQEVCAKEPKFLLWRKQSYPGAFRRRQLRGRSKGGSCRDKLTVSSADEAEELREPHSSRTELRRLREEFLLGVPSPSSGGSSESEDELMTTLQRILYGSGGDMAALIDRLKQQLVDIRKDSASQIISEQERRLYDVLRRYYSKSTNRDKVITDLLTDRKKLERLYFELRRARGFGPRRGGNFGEKIYDEEEDTDPGSPPTEPVTFATQTKILTDEIHAAVARYKESEAVKMKKEEQLRVADQRRSSVDNDDVSPSVSDTIKRYLRMARKKSVDSDKADRFKRVNYDRNLRNIKGKGEPSISEDDDTDKGCQTDETWVEALKDLKLSEIEELSSPGSISPPPVPGSSKSSSLLASGHSFLASLFHGLQVQSSVAAGGGGGPAAMQKSKSSTSVVINQGTRLVSKKIWKSRSKSQSRATPSATSAWTPQGKGTWTNVTGRVVTLTDTSLLQLTEIERRILQKVALAKLQALNLGVNIKIPSESTAVPVAKPKRKAYLLKRKAITTGLFDASRSKDEKGRNESGGQVFGIPLGLCVENERASRLQDLRARGSFSSLVDAPLSDDKGSLESLMSPTLSMPGLDDISLGGTMRGPSTSGSLTAPPPTSLGVPKLVSACLSHLQSHIRTLGIFRVSSSKKRVRQLREDFDVGKELTLEDELCPHDVATLLKEYFRDLPDSLLCHDLYLPFIHTQRIRNRRLQHEALQHLIQLLPVPNRDTLLALLSFLAQVAANSDDYKDPVAGEWVTGNKMDSANLATLFAPNILHSPSLKTKDEMSQEKVDQRSDAINVIRSLIDNYQSFFQVSAELLDEVYIHMMDSHPEALDELLRRRDSEETEEGDDDHKYWSREAMTHEGAATGGPLGSRPRRLERGRDRLSKKRRDEERRRGGGSSDERGISSGDSGSLSPQTSQSDGIITASLKIPVPHVSSLFVNLDDIPYIEDADRHHITLGLSRSPPPGSESGLGSFSPPTRPPSSGSSWDSGRPASPPPITPPPRVSQMSGGNYTRAEASSGRHSYSRLVSMQSDRISKSISSASVLSSVAAPPPTSISSIGGEVLRSKTADIERMIRRHHNPAAAVAALTGSTTSVGSLSSQTAESKPRYRDAQSRPELGSSASSRAVWKRRELISSEPRERRNPP